MAEPRKPRVVWEPLPGSQTLALTCPCDVILMHGTRGPGKTDAQLMFFRKYVGQGYGPFWRGVIFDRTYKSLDDLIVKSLRWFPAFGDGARFLASKSDYRWVWPTGEQLLFRQVKKDSDYYNFHGQEFPYIGWNELSKFPTSVLFESMFSCNRSSFLPADYPVIDKRTKEVRLLPPIPLVTFATTNPLGAGHNWIKKRFISVAPSGKIVETKTRVFNPQTQQREDVITTQVQLFGSYKENKHLDPKYISNLERIKDPNKRKAWLLGDWNIVAGGALDDVWSESHNVIPRFKLPAGWSKLINRSFDWGSSKPFSIGWWAVANGEEVALPNGKIFAPVAGSLIRFAEWYGCEEDENGNPAYGADAGLRLSVKAICDGIKEREVALVTNGWIPEYPEPGPADNQIANVIESGTETIKSKMEDEGIYWKKSDKSSGSRKIRLQIIRDLLLAARTGEGPAMYSMDNCRAFISIMPTLPRDEDDPDDIDTHSEDHIADETGYEVLASFDKLAYNLDIKLPT